MNLDQLRRSLQALGYGTDTAAAQNEHINDAYRRIAGMFKWSWLEGQATAVTVVGNPIVDISAITDLRDIDAVRVEVASRYPDIRWLPPQEFRDLEHVDRDNGEPQYWSFFDAQLHLYPRPDQIYTVTIDYIKHINTLSSDTDTPLFDAEFHDVIKWGAAHLIAYRERDFYGIQFAEEQFMIRFSEMRRHYGVKQRQNSRQVRRSAFWDNVARVFE